MKKFLKNSKDKKLNQYRVFFERLLELPLSLVLNLLIINNISTCFDYFFSYWV